VYWFEGQTHKLGIGVTLPDLFKKTGLNFYVAGDNVSLKGLEGLATDRFGDMGVNAQALFGGTAHPQIVINRYTLHTHTNSELAEDLVHEMFHAAGLHASKSVGFWHPTDLPQVPWSEIQKHCAGRVK